MEWLNNWELEKLNNNITSNQYLTNSTSEGLRVTLTSIIELSEYLLNDRNHKYVLTGKMNQDPAEVIFNTQTIILNDMALICIMYFLEIFWKHPTSLWRK